MKFYSPFLQGLGLFKSILILMVIENLVKPLNDALKILYQASFAIWSIFRFAYVLVWAFPSELLALQLILNLLLSPVVQTLIAHVYFAGA